ncbi:MAG TPA: hypothetical protein VKB38_05135 [Terracidiphilus sp.]|nr:hypothetical protein [Terracidiphilus sp.]
MNSRCKAAAAFALAACLTCSYSFAGDPPAPAKKHAAAKKAAKPKGPTVEEQINSLRQELQSQIDGLKSDLANKDTELKQAQQQASDAQAAASKAQQALADQEQANTQNSAAVQTLQSTVTDLKNNSASLAATMSDETSAIKKKMENPDALYFKGVTLSPTGSFLAAETVWRQGAVGGDINTPFTAVPLQYSTNAQMSEFQGTGRQSRAALRVTGKLDHMTLSGYYEADWLSAGITSNNNQSNSYTMRQRQLWAGAKLSSGWDFTAGQGWSLATETTQGLTRTTEILPATIDPQYTAGFVWTRQYSFRVSKNIGNHSFLGASLENAETLNPAGSSLPTNLLLGSAGTGGGLYNPSANYSWNYSPDFIAKMAVEDPKLGHWELFGIERNFRERIYPNAGATPPSSTGAYNDVVPAGGIGGGGRIPFDNKKVSVGVKALWGKGVGRYGSSTIADITLRPDGTVQPLTGFSALGTIEVNPSPRLQIYANYGADEIDRHYWGKVGYGSPLTNMSGCNTEPVPGTGGANPYGGGGTGFNPAAPANCGNQTKDVQELTAGYWYNIYSGPKGRLRYGLQYAVFRRDLWSGAGGATNPSNGAHGTDNMFWTSMRYYLP